MSVSMFSQCKLVSDRGLRKQIATIHMGHCGWGRTFALRLRSPIVLPEDFARYVFYLYISVCRFVFLWMNKRVLYYC